MADIPPTTPPDEVSAEGEVLEGIPAVGESDRLQHLRLALETVGQQARTLNEEITRTMKRLGLPLSKDKSES